MRHDREIMEKQFEALLARFHPDRKVAAEKYTLVHEKLIKYFQWNGCSDSDEYADEVLDVVGKHFAEGKKIETQNIVSYCLGIARNKLYEYYRKIKQQTPLPEEVPSLPEQDETESNVQEELQLQCIDELKQSDRSMICQYYNEGTGFNVEKRTQLAQTFNLSENALRIHVHRIRERLKKCVSEKMKVGEE